MIGIQGIVARLRVAGLEAYTTGRTGTLGPRRCGVGRSSPGRERTGLTAVLERVVGDSKLRRFAGKAARLAAVWSFSPGKAAKGMETLQEELLAEKERCGASDISSND